MFARTLKVLVAATTALVVGTACKDPISPCDCVVNVYQAVASGAKVVPVPADTTSRAIVNVTTHTDATTPANGTITWSYAISTAPSGTIDSIAFYQIAFGVALPDSATAMLCAGAAACAATTGTATIIGPRDATSIRTSMRGYGMQVVFFTTTAQKAAGGAMRGTMYPNPSP